MKVLFLFLDGIGLGENDPRINPLARANMPYLKSLLGGRKLIRASAPFEGERAALYPLDACLETAGLPQSATGQAVLLTGINIPAALGYHYGPKPNPETAAYLDGHTLFSKTIQAGKTAALLNAYPPRYFEGIDSGKRLYSSIPLAAVNAGLTLFTWEDYFDGQAVSADLTGEGWRTFLGFREAPLFAPYEAGARLGEIARRYDFSFFEYWASDYAGHKQDMKWAVEQMEVFDGALKGLLESWRGEDGLILLTSDHGNMEDLSTRRHTSAPAPLLLFGSEPARQKFRRVGSLAEVAPAVEASLGD